MEEDNIYKRIQEAISTLPENFSILEEQIDVELQMEYFNYSRDLKSGFTNEMILRHQADLFDPDIPLDEKKNLLVLLASQEKVEAFRSIEKYAKNPDPELREWSILAFQESRMVIQSSLMDEQQVYISTGLGGKGQNLRYFVVFIGRENVAEYSSIQRKLIKNELEFAIQNNDGNIEEIQFEENLAISLLLLPVKTDLQLVFSGIINECNQYGDFVRQEIIITNVKRMSVGEIKVFINRDK
ncbi:MAG TPA: hypothetical protein VFC65_15090 [Prolixibacteraceae bacterium]|nr:hypothetical protein [Prolixibacteraceae bacterium]